MVVFVLAFFAADCKQQTKAVAPAAQQETTWRKLGEWSGHGNVQTESFTSDSGFLRIRWKATASKQASATSKQQSAPNQKPAPSNQQPAPSNQHLVITIHSSISGRPLQVAVDEIGPGENVAYVAEDPRVFFAKVECEGLDWSFSVDEGYSGPVIVGR